MLVFGTMNLAYLAVPKTGSMAFEDALRRHATMIIDHPPSLRHMNVRRYNQYLRPLLDVGKVPELELMAVVRDPVRTMHSWYKMRKYRKGSPFMAALEDLDFDDFVDATFDDPVPGYAKIGRMGEFLRDKSGRLGVHHLFAVEHISHLHKFIRERVGTDVTFRKMNVTDQEPFALDQRLESEWRAAHKVDCALYDSVAAAGHLRAFGEPLDAG